MTIYQKVDKNLNGRESKKVANNTYLQRRAGGVIALKYHSTDVVTYYPDGKTVLSTGGWRTSTTKLRFNESYSGLPIRVWANKGIWWIYTGKALEPKQRRFSCYTCPFSWNGLVELSKLTGNLSGEKTPDCPRCKKPAGYASPVLGEQVPFEEGLTIVESTEGWEIDPATVGQDPKAAQKLRRKVQAYAARFISELRAGNVPAPGPGDCFFCGMRVAGSNVPWGEAQKDRSHLMSHLEEGYFVPSLLVRALEVMPSSQAMKWAVGGVWQQPAGDKQKLFERLGGAGSPDFIWQQLSKCLSRYILRQLGEVA